MAVDAAGNVYVADTGNNRVEEFGPGGKLIGAWDNSATPASLSMSRPTGLALDSARNLWVADTGNSQLDEVNLATGSMTGWTKTSTAPETAP